MPGVPLPNLTLQQSAAARGDAGGGYASGVFDNSGFVVNFGDDAAVGAPAGLSWLWVAAGVGALWWVLRRGK